MDFSRRDILLNAAILGCASVLPHRTLAATAFGTGRLSTISDGHLVLPGSLFFDPMPKDELPALLDEFALSQERLEPECNLALYQDGDRNVLFDVGSGPDFMPSSGLVYDSLDEAGLSPEDITHVVFTHAHPDHIWGLLDEFEDPLFSEATYFMGRTEWDYWWDPETVNSIGDARRLRCRRQTPHGDHRGQCPTLRGWRRNTTGHRRNGHLRAYPRAYEF